MEIPVRGVTAMDHTADVGLEIRASSQEELLRRAALGLAWLLVEADPPTVEEERRLEVEAEDPAALLRAWLREILHLFQDDGFLPADARIEAIGGRLTAVVPGGRPEAGAVREIKGVTLHRLTAERGPDGWRGSVVFDV